MDVQKDFADLCALLNAKSVEFLIVGGYAVAFNGAPRFTGDLDLLVRPSVDHVAPERLLEERRILQLGRVPVQVHVMTSISGVSWGEAWASRQQGSYGDVPVCFIGRRALIANKRAAGRAKDLADIEALGPVEG